jgi:hypothetical protein
VRKNIYTTATAVEKKKEGTSTAGFLHETKVAGKDSASPLLAQSRLVLSAGSAPADGRFHHQRVSSSSLGERLAHHGKYRALTGSQKRGVYAFFN